MNIKSNSNFSLRKLLFTALIAGPLVTVPAPLWAIPAITAGNLSTTTNVTVSSASNGAGSTINVNATADRQVLTWKEFGSNVGGSGNTFGAADVINYFLPTSSSSILNVVSGGFYTTGTLDANYASALNGQILSNGNVYFLNPNGLTIGATANINVGGFYASTIGETLPGSIFGILGTLNFTGVTGTTPVVTVSPGAQVQAVGTGNNIKLYGKGVDVSGGNFFGNLFVTSNGGTAKFGTTGDVNIDRPGGLMNWEAKAKWDAWNGIKGLAQDEAKRQYIAEVERQQTAFS